MNLAIKVFHATTLGCNTYNNHHPYPISVLSLRGMQTRPIFDLCHSFGQLRIIGVTEASHVHMAAHEQQTEKGLDK